MIPTPRSSLLFSRLKLFLAAVLLTVVTAAGRAADETEPRFSSTLSPAQQAQTGLDQLTSDNVAVIDALVRRDMAASRLRSSTIRSTRFSQRHTEHEREIAGLAHLTAEQLDKLDRFVSLRIPAPAIPLDSDLPSVSIGWDNTPVAPKRPLVEVHGSVSLTYAWSKAGSVRGADTKISYVDPKQRFALIVGYSEYHGKGLAPYPYPASSYDYDPFYRPVRVITLDDR